MPPVATDIEADWQDNATEPLVLKKATPAKAASNTSKFLNTKKTLNHQQQDLSLKRGSLLRLKTSYYIHFNLNKQQDFCGYWVQKA